MGYRPNVLGEPKMSTAFTLSDPAVLSTALTPGKSIPFPCFPKDRPLIVEIGIPDFHYEVAAPIVEFIPATKTGNVFLSIPIDPSVFILLTLNGKLDQAQEFRIEQTDVKINRLRNVARADFISSSLLGMMGLAETVHIRIPEIELSLALKFELSLLDISEMLQRRLLSRRIMTIERTIDHEFELPSFIPAEEVKSISLIFHAIVERSFDWPINYIDYGFPATKEIRDKLVALNKLPSVKFGPHPKTEKLFSKLISLGQCFVTIEDKYVEDFDRVIAELATNDDHIVKLTIRSKSGHGRYEFLDAPRLPTQPWDHTIQQFIAVDGQLDMQLVSRYQNLATETLAGLSDEEKQEVTRRPELDNEAFSLED